MAGWSTPDATPDDSSAPVAPGDEPYVAPAGGSWSTPGAATSSSWSTPGAAPKAAAPHKGGGLGSQLGSMLNPLNLVKGISHIAGEVGQSTGLTPRQFVDTVEHINPWFRSSAATKTQNAGPAVDALFGKQGGPNKGEKGLHVFAQESPTLYQAGRGLEHTVQGVPDIAVNAAEDLSGHGPGLANSLYGRDIHEQGVAPWLLQQAGNVAMLASGGATAGSALGFGGAAEAAGAEGLAARAVANVGEKGIGAVDTAAKAQAAAEAARAAGNASAAAEYESAAANLQKAEAARAASAARSPLAQAAEQATAGAKTVAHFGNQVAGAPAELYTKLVPKVADVATFGKAGELASAAGERLGESGVGERMAARSTMKELFGKQAGEEQRLANPVNSATAQIKRLLPDEQDQMAAYLARSGDAATVLPHLATLPDAEIQAVIDRNPFLAQEGVTPAAVRKAADVAAGTLPAAEQAQFAQAHQLMDESVYGPKEARHVAGYGDKAPMNPIKQAGREANVAGQPAPIAVGQLEDRLTLPLDRRLADIEAEVRDIRQRNLDPQTGDLTDAAQRQIARDEATAKSIRRQVAKEEARQGRVAAAAEKERARAAGRGDTRIGTIAGRARETMAEQGQLREGLASERGSLDAAAARATKNAAAAEAKGAAAREASFGARGERVTPKTIRANAAEAVTGAQAAEAQAAADQLKGVARPKSDTEIQRQTNRAAAVANARTTGETTTTDRLTGAEGARQESALQSARRQLAGHEETAGARAERLQHRADARTFRDDQNRLAVLDERRAALEARRTAAVEGAPNHPSVQAPQVRSLLSHAGGVSEALLARADELEATDPGLAAQLRAAAAAQPKGVADLGGAAKYIAGGEVPEGGVRSAGSAGARIRSRVLTDSERARETDVAPLTAEGQRQQVLADIAGRPRNDLPRMVQHELGSTAAKVATEHGLEGEALAAHLAELKAPGGGGYTAWDPEGSGGKLAAHKVTADSPVIPTRLLEQYHKWTQTKDPSALGKIAENVNRIGRTVKLVGSAFPLHKMGADALLNYALAGVSPVDSLSHLAETVKNVREGTLPADVGIQTSPPRLPAETLGGRIGNAGNKAAEIGMKPFRMFDTANRDIVYRTLVERGYSPQTAAELTKQAAGDLAAMSPAEKAAGRKVLTYYPWQKHLATVAKSLVAAHPAGLAQAEAVAQADARAHPGQEAQRGELADFLNPFGSFIGTPTPKAGQNMAEAIAERVQQSINPLLELGGGALAGVNLHKGQPVTTPSHPFGSQGGGEGPLIAHPGDLANFALHTMVPQVGQVQDIAGGAKGAGGFIPYRQDTGQPESKGGSRGRSGGVQAQPGTTKLDAIARLLGFPHAEKAPPKKTGKRGR